MTQQQTTPNFYDDNAKGGTSRLLNAFSFADAPEWIPYLPIPNNYTHNSFGKINITQEGNLLFVENFNAGVYQTPVPIDAEHETKVSGALGWITELRQNSDGSVDAKADWTDRGVKMLEADRFKFFSPEFYGVWQDPATQEIYKNVAIGGALTTRPFFKEKALRPLIASESVIITTQEDNSMSDKVNERLGALEDSLKATESQLQASKAENDKLSVQATELLDQNKTLTERIITMEALAQTKRFTELIGNDGEQWAGDQSTHLMVLGTITQSFGEKSEQFKSYVTSQVAMANQLADSDLFKEVGSSGSGDAGGNAEQKLENATRVIMSENPKMKDDYYGAYAQATQENPQLYNEYMEGK